MGCIVLNSLPESIRALTSLFLSSSFFWQNLSRYQMYSTRSKVASLLVSIIKTKVTKINTSFLRCSGFMEVWNNSSQNTPSCYSCNKWPRLCLLDLRYCVPCRVVSRIKTNSQKAEISPSLHLAVVPFFLLFVLLVEGFDYEQGV